MDLRKTSAAYRKWVCVELSAANKNQPLIPAGFGHAALTLEDDTAIVMRINAGFDPALAKAIRCDNPDIGIPFPVSNPILSQQDQNVPRLIHSGCNL